MKYVGRFSIFLVILFAFLWTTTVSFVPRQHLQHVDSMTRTLFMSGSETGNLPNMLLQQLWLMYPVVFAACFRIGAALSVINQPRLPEIDGYPVGSKILRLPYRQGIDIAFFDIT